MPLPMDRLRNTLLAGAAGDAIGGPFEGRGPRHTVPLPLRPWRWSDDTVFSMATARALTDAESVDPAAIAEAMRLAWKRERIQGIGASTLKAMRDLDAGVHWALAGRRGERAAGNGAAMRIAPLAFWVDTSSHTDRRAIRDVCRITHHSEEAYVGALAMLVTMQLEASKRPSRGEALLQIVDQLPDTAVRDALLGLKALPEDSSALDCAELTGTSGYVAHSVPLAIAIALGTGTLEEAILAAVACGGDTDTVASMVGHIRGGWGEKVCDEWQAELAPLRASLPTVR